MTACPNLGTLITTLFELGTTGFVAAALTAPLLASKGLRGYLNLLAPLLVTTALNFVAAILVYGFSHTWGNSA